MILEGVACRREGDREQEQKAQSGKSAQKKMGHSEGGLGRTGDEVEEEEGEGEDGEKKRDGEDGGEGRGGERGRDGCRGGERGRER